MKLKTLKDIKGIYSNGSNKLGELHINNRDLRQEAIKWIKELQQFHYDDEKGDVQVSKFWDKIKKEYPQFEEFLDEGCLCSQIYAIEGFIKHFFNIGGGTK